MSCAVLPLSWFSVAFGHAFDGEGNRTRQSLNDCLVVRFVYDGPNVMMEINASNEVVQLGLGHRSNISRAVRSLEAPDVKSSRLKAIMLECRDCPRLLWSKTHDIYS